MSTLRRGIRRLLVRDPWARTSRGWLPPISLIELRRLRSNPEAKYSMVAFDQLDCVFVHIPKTAGVSVSTALFGHNAGGHQTMAEYLWLYGPNELARRYSFSFVRNPWDRVYSAWRFLRAGGTEPADAAFGEDVIGRYTDFDSFVRSWLTPRTACQAIHFVPQRRFLELFSRPVAVDFVGRFEHLDEDFAKVCKALDIERDLGHLNRSAGNYRYQDAYTSASRERVAAVYAEDIAHFGYQF